MKKLNTILVFILFVTLALVIGANHEPWADEAQSWIIARDASCGEIIWDISRYEGTFPLWFLTIKLFISLGLQYEYFFIIPIIISSIGLLVFLKLVDCPKFVKVLLPFSYYVSQLENPKLFETIDDLRIKASDIMSSKYIECFNALWKDK